MPDPISATISSPVEPKRFRAWHPVDITITPRDLVNAYKRSKEPDGSTIDFTTPYCSATDQVRRIFDKWRQRDIEIKDQAREAERARRYSWQRVPQASSENIIEEPEIRRTEVTITEVELGIYEYITLMRTGELIPENNVNAPNIVLPNIRTAFDENILLLPPPQNLLDAVTAFLQGTDIGELNIENNLNHLSTDSFETLFEEGFRSLRNRQSTTYEINNREIDFIIVESTNNQPNLIPTQERRSDSIINNRRYLVDYGIPHSPPEQSDQSHPTT